MMGFNHEVLGLTENPARANGFFRQNTSGYALQNHSTIYMCMLVVVVFYWLIFTRGEARVNI